MITSPLTTAIVSYSYMTDMFILIQTVEALLATTLVSQATSSSYDQLSEIPFELSLPRRLS